MVVNDGHHLLFEQVWGGVWRSVGDGRGMIGRVGIRGSVWGSVGSDVWRGDDRGVDGGGGDEWWRTPTSGTSVVDTTSQRRWHLSGGGVEIVACPIVDTSDGHGAASEGKDGKSDENLWERWWKILKNTISLITSRHKFSENSWVSTHKFGHCSWFELRLSRGIELIVKTGESQLCLVGWLWSLFIYEPELELDRGQNPLKIAATTLYPRHRLRLSPGNQLLLLPLLLSPLTSHTNQA